MKDEEGKLHALTRRIPARKIIALLAVSAAALFLTTQVAPHLLLPGPPEQPVASAPQAPAPPPETPVVENEPTPAAPEVAVAEVEPPVFNPPAEETAAPPPVAESDARVHDLEEQLKRAQAENKLLLSTETIRLLDGQLKQHETQLRTLKIEQDAAWRTVAALNAYDRLKEAAMGGRPFSEELLRIQQLIGTADEAGKAVAMLTPYAPHGIPQVPFLQSSFDATARRAMLPEITPEDGFFRRLSANVAKLITVRKVGVLKGSSTEAVIARAEVAVRGNDIAAAVRELSALKGSALTAFTPWTAQANAYLSLPVAFAAIKSSIFAGQENNALTPSAPPPPPPPP